MNILEVVYGLSSGGAERFVVDLCNEISKTEQVSLLVLKDVEQFYAPQVSASVRIIYANIPSKPTAYQHLFVCKIIREIHPDIVHYHSQARYSCVLANILFRSKTRFYLTIHSDVNKGYKRGISGIQMRVAGSIGRTRFVTISPENHKQFSEVYPKYPVQLIENGRALPVLSGKISAVHDEIVSYKQDKDTAVYVHIARCAAIKNQKLLIEAFNRHIQKGADAILLIIGADYDSPLGLELKSMASPGIYFLGRKENVYDYLHFADAFCLSSFQEGMPMSIIEAVLSGVPVISTPVCGAVDAVINGFNGYLSDGFSVSSYLEALERFEQNMDTIGRNADQNKRGSSYCISVCAERYLRWFTEG